jgi:hypothetical protein
VAQSLLNVHEALSLSLTTKKRNSEELASVGSTVERVSPVSLSSCCKTQLT